MRTVILFMILCVASCFLGNMQSAVKDKDGLGYTLAGGSSGLLACLACLASIGVLIYNPFK
jgi:hypothetical protein